MSSPCLVVGVVGHNHCCFSDTIILATLDCDGHEQGPLVTLSDVAARVDYLHAKNCPCEEDLGLAEHIWLANSSYVGYDDFIAVLEHYYPNEDQRLDKNTRLTEIYVGTPPPDTIHLFFGREPGPQTRNHQFRGVRRQQGDVCRVSHSSSPSLPPPDVTDYRVLTAVPGMCFVDKTEWIEMWYMRNTSAFMPIIHRPAGYGKSTFLSMCAAAFGDRVEHQSVPTRRLGNSEEPIRRPVLKLDFAKLDLWRDSRFPSVEDMLARADEFMERAATDFWATYSPDKPFVREEHYYTPHCMIKALSKYYGLQIFLAIDNYSHPFLGAGMSAFRRAEDVIWRKVLGPMFESCQDATGVIFRGLIVGTYLHEQRPFDKYFSFASVTEDLTDSVEFGPAIGFTVNDLRHLCRAVFPGDAAQEEKLLLACSPPFEDGVLFCAADVLKILRAMLNGENLAETQSPDFFVPGRHMQFAEDLRIQHSRSDDRLVSAADLIRMTVDP